VKFVVFIIGLFLVAFDELYLFDDFHFEVFFFAVAFGFSLVGGEVGGEDVLVFF
jgi:hypothetical protein